MPDLRRLLILPAVITVTFACGSASDSKGAGNMEMVALRDVACVDQSIAQLMLFEPPSPNPITTETSKDGVFDTLIDATGGGLRVAQSFVYARFTKDGLEKVTVGDEDAFGSLDWHIAFRRYVIRLNSGVSGPGSVTGARTLPDTAFDTLSLAPSPDDVPYRTEEYFTNSCEYVTDGSGIGSPATALASFWKYQQCVQMTGNVFVLALPDQRHVKLQVMSYYEPEPQRTCDMTGKVPSPSGAGSVRIRWAFLD
jgi:hypothetical protein